MTERGPFDPSKYLSKVGKADYLEVKWRLVWLRDVAPEATLDTEHIRLDDLAAIFKATVQLPTGARATGYGNCTAEEFGDYIEKAESKAIGRALAALGFGTQFAGDFAEGTKIADSPVRRGANVRAITPAGSPPAKASGLLEGQAIYELVKLAEASGWNRPALETEARRRFNEASLGKLTIAQGKELAEWAMEPRTLSAAT